MSRSRDPAEAYREERQIFHDNLMDLKQLPRFAEHLSSMPQFVSEGFHETEVRLAHELSNLTNTNVVTNAVENLELNPNSSQGLAEDVNANTDYLISLSYRWGSPEWLEMRRRLMEMSGTKASTTRKQRGIFRTLRGTGLVWQL